MKGWSTSKGGVGRLGWHMTHACGKRGERRSRGGVEFWIPKCFLLGTRIYFLLLFAALTVTRGDDVGVVAGGVPS